MLTSQFPPKFTPRPSTPRDVLTEPPETLRSLEYPRLERLKAAIRKNLGPKEVYNMVSG